MRRTLLLLSLILCLQLRAEDFVPITLVTETVTTEPETTESDAIEADAQVTPEDAVITEMAAEQMASPARTTSSYIQLAVGHPETLLEGRYQLTDERSNSLLLKVDHQSQWGFRTLEWSAVSLDYAHRFASAKVYTKLSGANLFFTRYGRYYMDSTGGYTIRERYASLQHDDRQAMWRATATVGIQSNEEQALQYKAEMIYQYYTFQHIMTEHQCNLRLNVDYHKGAHTIGCKTYYESHFTQLTDSTQAYYTRNNLMLNPVHCIRLEPFYDFHGARVSLHVGVNLDLNVGRGNLMSLTNDSTPLAQQVSFAPSPAVKLDVQLVPDKVQLYAGVLGSFGTSSMTGYVRLNPYIGVKGAPSSHHVSGYIPVAAKIGFQFRPTNDLRFHVEAGYRYALHQAECAAVESTSGATSWEMMRILYNDFQRWRTNAELNYHYKDYFHMHVAGTYYFYRGVKNNTTGTKLGALGEACCTEGRVYDRPNWEVEVRLEGHINRHWSVYSENSLKGQRWAITSLGDRRLPAFIDLNIGAGYRFGETANEALNRLSVFAEVQNVLNRKNMVWYGYDSVGLHGRVGLTYQFN